MTSARMPAAISPLVRLKPDTTAVSSISVASAFRRTDAAIDTATAVHTASTIGPDQIKNAGGAAGESHGSATNTSSHSGTSDAPARQATQTSAAAATTRSIETIER